MTTTPSIRTPAEMFGQPAPEPAVAMFGRHSRFGRRVTRRRDWGARRPNVAAQLPDDLRLSRRSRPREVDLDETGHFGRERDQFRQDQLSWAAAQLRFERGLGGLTDGPRDQVSLPVGVMHAGFCASAGRRRAPYDIPRQGSESAVYAIVRSGGRQEKVSVGDVINLDRLDHEPGTTVTLPALLLVDGDTVTADRAALSGVTVTAEVLGRVKGPKIDVLRFKNKTGYRRRLGHRQKYTQVKVTGIDQTTS
jgi:large subunit ribosomal protein L21